MKRYLIHMEREGRMIPVGEICGEDHRTAVFSYLQAYLQQPDAVPVSLSLPLQEEPFAPERTRNFFEGLLPEGFTRRSVAQWLRLGEEDYLSILHGLGRECLGALRVCEEGERTEASYEKITREQVRALAAEGATRSTELVTRSHLSLTGASGKVGLYYAGQEGNWYLPKGSAPSTHIVKQSHVRLQEIVTNEQLCMRTAGKCGIEVPDSFILRAAEGTGEAEVLFATQRYDRVFGRDPEMIDGLPCPLRLHQEDMAQAMGIPAADEYEPAGEQYLHRMFDILRLYASDPVRDMLRLWDLIVFHYLVGNTDAHVKNYSLLYSADGHALRLAPAYDIVSTAVYESSTREMAFRIGGDLTLDRIDRASFRRAAGEAGLGGRIALQRFDTIAMRFRDALQESAGELEEEGFAGAGRIEERILRNGGITRV